MEFYEELLHRSLGAAGDALWRDPAFQQQIATFLESACCRTLRRIREIVADDALTDADCFARVEELVSALERLGLSCGARHDF